jgi:hypothetical protein
LRSGEDEVKVERERRKERGSGREGREMGRGGTEKMGRRGEGAGEEDEEGGGEKYPVEF